MQLPLEHGQVEGGERPASNESCDARVLDPIQQNAELHLASLGLKCLPLSIPLRVSPDGHKFWSQLVPGDCDCEKEQEPALVRVEEELSAPPVAKANTKRSQCKAGGAPRTRTCIERTLH